MTIISSLLTLAIAVAIASATQPGEEPCCSGTKDQRSLLSEMLVKTAHTDICVAVALNVCGAGQTESSYASLIEEAREVVQQASAAVNESQSVVSDAVIRECQLSAAESKSGQVMITDAMKKMESMLKGVVNETKFQLSAIVNKLDTKLSVALDRLGPGPRHCQDLKDSGDRGSGPRRVYPYAERPLDGVTVVCEQDVDGGGWTVFQRRSSDAERQDFFRTWREYQDGFGDLQGGEFWGGLDLLHQLTSSTPSQLRIDLHDYEGEHRWAKYGQFSVGGPDTNYRLTIAQYTGDATDSLQNSNGIPFSTHDADHDRWSENCASKRKGGWWYNICGDSNLNGYQHVGSDGPDWEGIFWWHWRGIDYSMKQTTMMTKPV